LDILEQIEEEDQDQFIEVYQYLTGNLKKDHVDNIYLHGGDNDAITGLATPTYFGRPDFHGIFSSLQKSHPGKKIGVFVCGPPAITRTVKMCCDLYTVKQKGSVKFEFHMEHF
jgi:hypothetical protein